MRDVRVALAQIAPVLGDPEANLATHLDLARQAAAGGADWVVFPELSLTGYHLLDQVPEVALRADAPLLAELARASRDVDIVAGFVEESPEVRYHNAAAWFREGRLAHVQRKLYLPTYGMFQEGRDFAPGETLRAADVSGVRAGVLICEDLWHPSCAWLLAQEGAEVLVGLSNGPTRGARPGSGITSLHVWRELLQVTAQFQTTWAVYVNRVGCEDGLTFGGGSMVVDPFGRVVAELDALEPALEIVPLEAEVLRRARTAYPVLRDENLPLVRRELDRVLRRRWALDEDAATSPDADPETAPEARETARETTPGPGPRR